ncbi:MAG: L-threonylcarbamoyladenylate synthase [Pseudoflavonifractor sp.]|nr:L-threonylcarbamoyladenylate synthase [Pseudoflavonifractor sp.]
MEILRIYPTSINGMFIDEAADALREGKTIIYPTDTLYAIGCDALNNSAIERLCKIKGINPAKTNLSIVCRDIAQASEYARIDNRAFKILRDNLPGPFTFLLPAATTLPKVFKGRKIVGIRIPANPIATALVDALGNPILTTSIQWSPDLPEEAVNPVAIAARYEGTVALVIDGGEGQAEPSTIVDLTDSASPEIIRQGLGNLD